MERIKTDDLKLPQEVFSMRLERRAKLREAIEGAMPDAGKLLDLFNEWTPDAGTRKRILADNPAKLYGFPL